MIALKRLSDGLFLLSIGLLVVAIVTGSLVLYVVAALLFVAAFVITALKRRQVRASRAG